MIDPPKTLEMFDIPKKEGIEMVEILKTLEEAKAHRYGKWAGRPNGVAYREGYCAETVWGQYSWGGRQCSRKNGHGPSGLYCWQHAKKVEGHDEQR